jgi:hypothetical protein
MALAIAGCDEEQTSQDCCDAGTDDSDTDEPPECPLNSGWPCECEAAIGPECEDGSPCLEMILDDGGSSFFCTYECADEEDDCPPTPYPSDGLCDLYSDATDTWFCVMYCALSSHCPPEQECTGWGTTNVCLPPPAW